MPPRPAPDPEVRRERIREAARELAEAEGWGAVAMRRLAAQLGVTQPVLYTAFDSRQALVDAVASSGFDDLAAALELVEAAPLPRMRAYLDFAAEHPRTYEAMFSLPSQLAFASERTAEQLQRAFRAIRDAVPDADETAAEVAWSALHGLAALDAAGRLRPASAEARLAALDRVLRQENRP